MISGDGGTTCEQCQCTSSSPAGMASPAMPAPSAARFASEASSAKATSRGRPSGVSPVTCMRGDDVITTR
jgi:hypothetical protein